MTTSLISATVLIGESTRDHFVDVDDHWWSWAIVIGVVIALLMFDILVLHRRPEVPSTKRAIIETCGWIAVGVTFGLVILSVYGGTAATEYYSGYLIELSLSIDNVFVWALLLTYFAVKREYQHRVLFWGIFGAVILRAIFVFGGIALVNRFDWVLIVFGVFLVYSAIKLLRHDDDSEVDAEGSRVLRMVRRIIPSTTDYDGQKLFTHIDGKRLATPLFAVLVLIETTDVLFAVDSVPAVLGVARDQFIVLTSNAFAILGLRALYFLFADLRDRFNYLQQGLALILAFVGVKMIISRWVEISTPISLGVIVVVLVVAIIASLASDEPVSMVQVPSANDDGGEFGEDGGRAEG
jgi:tellurite resistance protein TerC